MHPPPAATPEPTPYEARVTTGYEKDIDYPEGEQITGVMVNDIQASQPQRGLSAADILFEIKVEGGIARFVTCSRRRTTFPGNRPHPFRP